MDQIRQLIQEEVLSKAHLMSLAVVDESGPWASYVIFVFDEDLNIYWLSDEKTRHSQAILKNPKASGAISVNHRSGEDDIAVQFSGIAEKVEGDILPMAIQHRLKRGRPAPIKEGEILDPGESWYKLTPEFFDLIHQPLFGFKKQRYDL